MINYHLSLNEALTLLGCMMKTWKLFGLLCITLSGASFAQDKDEIALNNLGNCLAKISTNELKSNKSNPVLATALLTSVYKNIGFETGTIQIVEDKYIKLYKKANDHCSKDIVAFKKLINEKS